MESHLHITAHERQALLEQYRKGMNPRVRLRAHILLLLAQGYSWAVIAGVLFCSSRTIARWKSRVELKGITAILKPATPSGFIPGQLVARTRGPVGAGVEAAGFWLRAQSLVLWRDCLVVAGNL